MFLFDNYLHILQSAGISSVPLISVQQHRQRAQAPPRNTAQDEICSLYIEGLPTDDFYTEKDIGIVFRYVTI